MDYIKYIWNGTVWVEAYPVPAAHTHTAADITSGTIDNSRLPSTFEGVKTFTSIPVLPASNPTSANQAVRKSYVDTTFYTRTEIDSMIGNIDDILDSILGV